MNRQLIKTILGLFALGGGVGLLGFVGGSAVAEVLTRILEVLR